MPLSSALNHPSKNLFDILVGCFHSSVVFWSLWSRIVVHNFELLAYLLHQITIDVCSISCDDSSWDTKSTNNVWMNKIHDRLLSDCFESYRLHPFGEVINCNQNESMSIRVFWINWSNYIHSPCNKGPRSSHRVQLWMRWMNEISMDLTLMTFFSQSESNLFSW